MKFTTIIATIGPASHDVETIRALIRAGTNCCRLNFSHADGASMAKPLANVREAARLEQLPVAVLGDIQGPKLRVGELPAEGVDLVEGEPLTYGMSITDGCIGWDSSVAVLERLAQAVKARRLLAASASK